MVKDAKKGKTSLWRQLKARVPRDDPFMRHEKLKQDLKSGIAGPEKKELAHAKPVGERTVGIEKGLSNMRRVALEQARNAKTRDEGAIMPVAPTSGVSNWVPLGPSAIPRGQTYSEDVPVRVNVTGRITSIIVDPTDPDIIYIGAGQGGVWKTVNGGKNWAPKSDHEISLAIGALAMDPTNHLVLYAGTGEGNFSLDSYYGNGVLKTIDGGESWASFGESTFSGARFCRIAVSPVRPTTIFAATVYDIGGVYRSTDGGNNWIKMANGLPEGDATDLVIDPENPETVYAAFSEKGIYKTSNANDAMPSWTKLAGGLPGSGFARIALGISLSSPKILYVLMTDSDGDKIDKFYATNDRGTSWTKIALPNGNIGGQGFYNINIAVDPTTPDIVYLSGISLWKAERKAATNSWKISDIGSTIHADNHALVIHPTNHSIIYAGTDGGIYISRDGGMSWKDNINKGLCITMFEFIDQHPTLDGVLIGGTQDNGTEMFRNSPVFYHAKDGDGGFCTIDPRQPNNILSTYYNLSPFRSIDGGKFENWKDISQNLWDKYGSLFYPPMTLDQSNPNNVAIGGEKLFLDAAQGTGGWPTKISLPGLTGFISAINYANSDLIYVGTIKGQVYRLTKKSGGWTASLISAAPLPSRWIWDVATKPGDVNTILVVMSGFRASHVWRGEVPANGTATWTDISGNLPDIPVNAIAIEPNIADTMYIASDVAVFRTINGGATWTPFSEGLPNCAVFDLRLHISDSGRILRAATHGRGIWERRLDVPTMHDIDIFVRDNLVDTGRATPSPSGVPAPFEDPLQHVNLGDTLWWWQCADIKIDSLEGSPLSYQMNVDDVDYVAFESKLEHRNPQRGRVNRVYVQVLNRGIKAASNVTVKIMYANASAGLPNLPPDFWKAFPGDSADTTNWKPIGAAKLIPSLSPTEPATLEWDWSTPQDAADHSCLLVIADCPDDPIQANNKVFSVDNLVPNEKHVGLKNLHVVDVPAGKTYWTAFKFFGNPELRHSFEISDLRSTGWTVGLIFEQNLKIGDAALKGIESKKPTMKMLNDLRTKIGNDIKRFDISKAYMLQKASQGGIMENLILPKEGVRAMLLFAPPARGVRAEGSVSIIQKANERVVGGSTFILRIKTKT